MDKIQFKQINQYMERCMQQNIHDAAHSKRVFYLALRIAEAEPKADRDVVMAAALLHDIGRKNAEKNPEISHAQLGGDMAYAFLRELGWPRGKAGHVRECIHTHSRKGGRAPQSLEAKILFDADKLDLSGAVGVARVILFGGQIAEPFYTLAPNGMPRPGKVDEAPSLLREYSRKLKNADRKLYTKKGKKMSKKRQKQMDVYFSAFRREINSTYKKGENILNKWMAKSDNKSQENGPAANT